MRFLIPFSAAMERFLTVLRYLLATLSVLVLLLTLASVLPYNQCVVGAGAEFSRLQTLAVLAVALVGLLALGWPVHRRAWLLLLLGSSAGLVVQASFLWPYLPLAFKPVADACPGAAVSPRILVINVLMTNRQDGRLRQLVTEQQPDVLLALGPDAWWARALQPLQSAYPYRVELPRADAYGMLLYSRLPLADTQVQDLLQNGVPSSRTHLCLLSNHQITFYGVHPIPPITDSYPDGVGQRGRALRKVANAVRLDTLPSIVAGDFNDVSWSATIHQLTRNGELHDVSPRRGLYNTFDARSHLVRWPLDHFFVSAPGRVVALKRLPDVGSNHFPLWVELALEPTQGSATKSARTR